MRRLMLLILLGCAVCGASAQETRFQLIHDYLIVVQCSIGDLQGMTAVVDTGSTDTVLDQQVVERLGLRSKPDTATIVDRQVAVESIVAPAISVGPVRSTPQNAIAADLSKLTSQLGIHVDAVIGMDVLRTTDFEIDYQARMLRFGPVRTFRHRAAMTERDGLAMVELTGLATPMRLLVDTGFSALVVYRQRIGGEVKSRDAVVRLATSDGAAPLRAFQAMALRIGDWQSVGQTLLIADDRSEKPFDGLLGPRFLKARRVAFDFRHQMLTWE